jgi:hypothetical protein
MSVAMDVEGDGEEYWEGDEGDEYYEGDEAEEYDEVYGDGKVCAFYSESVQGSRRQNTHAHLVGPGPRL